MWQTEYFHRLPPVDHAHEVELAGLDAIYNNRCYLQRIFMSCCAAFFPFR